MRERMRTALVCAVVLAVGLAATAGASRLITGGQIKNGSIGLADLSKSAKRALSGRAGPVGPAGPQGPPGPAGVNTILRASSPTVTLAPGDSSYDVQLAGGPSLVADCPAGQVVVGSGFDDSVGSVGFVESFGSFVGGFIYNDTSITIEVTVQAMCVPGAATGTTAVSPAQADAAFERAAVSQEQRFER